MDELGSILREAREMKGLTLAQAQEETRINARFLEALETGNYDALPTPVHVRGFLRNYARFLELEPEPLIERYEASKNHRPPPVATTPHSASPDNPLPPREDQPFFTPVNMGLDGETEGGADSTVRLAIIVALLITIGLAASNFLPQLLGRQEERSDLPQMIEGILSNEQEIQETPAAESDVPAVTSEPINPTGRNNVEQATSAAGTPDVTPLPTRPPLPATMESIHLQLDITERTWMRVTIDSEVVFEGQVTQGEVFEWDAENEAHLLTGNAAGVFITINDQAIGKLGGRGVVAEEQWVTTRTGN